MSDRTDLAVVIGIALVAVLGMLLLYQIALFGARRAQRSMSTRQRLRKRHWAIRIDDAIASRRQAKIRSAEKRALQKRRRSR